LRERRALARLPLARRRSAAGDPAVERARLVLGLYERDRGTDALLNRPGDLGLLRDREVAANVPEQGLVRIRGVVRIAREALHRLLTCLQDGAPVLQLRLRVGVRVDQILDRAVD